MAGQNQNGNLRFNGFLIIVISLIPASDAQCSPTTSGTKRFGTGCKYACHCNNNEQCDYTTGECGSGCDFEWVGPSCQYKNIALGQISRHIDNIVSAQWSSNANDQDLSTCSYTDSANPLERQTTSLRSAAPWWSLWLPNHARFRELLFVTRHDSLCKTCTVIFRGVASFRWFIREHYQISVLHLIIWFN
ncbi:uncharacterized protein LOC128557228 [Mercenaria mercenaria]|uniref:uncharacterized protein LOC128557228 n=1 Tax=Mercenaria mercenaria TaxID=6596 RepID=UPI00234E4A1C|nr:uncharacterized protein LOC128557228 [Mercenaria mercenaria]